MLFKNVYMRRILMKIEEKYKLEKYIKEDGSEVNVYFDIDRQTIWMSQKDLRMLFNKSKSTISFHINNMDYDLKREKNIVQEFDNIEQGCSIFYYNYDVVLYLNGKIRNSNISKFVEWINNSFLRINEQLSYNTKKYEIVEFNDENISLDVNVDYEHDTVWLTQEQIAFLYDVDRSRISRHINNIYEEKELDKDSTCAENAHMGSLGMQTYTTMIYNFDMVLAIGYRVNSKRGILFRKWASSVLKKYSFNGYAINEKRCLDCQSV